MKKIYFFTLFLLYISASFSQTTEVVATGLSEPLGIAVGGNFLYVAEFGGQKISKIDLTDTSTLSEDVISIPNTPQKLLINDNILFIA